MTWLIVQKDKSVINHGSFTAREAVLLPKSCVNAVPIGSAPNILACTRKTLKTPVIVLDTLAWLVPLNAAPTLEASHYAFLTVDSTASCRVCLPKNHESQNVLLSLSTNTKFPNASANDPKNICSHAQIVLSNSQVKEIFVVGTAFFESVLKEPRWPGLL